MTDRSDYTDPRTNLVELLPSVFRSQVNQAVFEDVFNRYLSNPQIESVDGYVGAPRATQIADRQIQEPTACRQAFQLQPLMFSKVGTVNFLKSYDDILNELRRVGVEECRLPLWGNAKVFNWIPPVDIDKIVNFREYYWYDPVNLTEQPQYITVENLCNKALQRLEAYEETIKQFGVGSPVTGEFAVAALEPQQITLNGNLEELFVSGFVFLVRNSTNSTINNRWFTVESSVYDDQTDSTLVNVEEDFSDTTTENGTVSIEEFKTIYQAEFDYTCVGGSPTVSQPNYTIAAWVNDDLGEMLWTDDFLGDNTFATAAEWITANGAPVINSLWYDTTNDQWRQYDGSVWQVVYDNFSSLLNAVSINYRDQVFALDIANNTNQWSQQNNWYHQNHVPNFSVAKQAQLPIIEYSAFLELNKWSFVDYLWEYRADSIFDFEPVTQDNQRVEPTLNELIPFEYVITGSPAAFTITLSPEYGDRTEDYPVGSQFKIVNDTATPANNGTYTVANIEYTSTSLTTGSELATVITTVEQFASTTSTGEFTPVLTSVGDTFKNYTEHWLLVDQQVLPVPAPAQEQNPYAAIDTTQTPTATTVNGVPCEFITSTPVDVSTNFTGPDIVYSIQYTVLGGSPLTDVPALSNFDFATDEPGMSGRVISGENDVRVFVDNQQVYNFAEVVDSNGFVSGVRLFEDLSPNTVVRISLSPAAASDIGRAVVPARTVREDDKFAAASGSPVGGGSPIVLGGSPQVVQPTNVSLVKFRYNEQDKTERNQYPLYDMFTCLGEPLYQATSLFAYKEDSTESVNPQTGLRLATDENGNIAFEQYLVDGNTQPEIYAFKLNGQLQTIWRQGLNQEEYVPEYVDVNKEPTTVGDPDGCWEVADQLYFNAQHENRESVTFPEVLTHFRTIINAQNNAPGFTGVSGRNAYLLQNVNYGLGGTIKEFNDSYDTFLSSVFVNNITPRGIIDFAHDQYVNSLNTIKELYRREFNELLTRVDDQSINNLQQVVTDVVINLYETNDFFSVVYGDSNTFIQGSPELGVKNWPATLPFVRLGFKQQPYIIEDSTLGFKEIVHHDGHRSRPGLTASVRESLIQVLINTKDPRTNNVDNFGIQVGSVNVGSPQLPSTAPPDDYNILASVINPRAGIYWYDTGSTERVLYRFNVVSVGSVTPGTTVVGSLWYDTGTDTLRELQNSLLWTPVVTGSPSVGNRTITDAWVEVDVDDLLLNTILEVEQRLYDAAPDLDELAFDVNDWLTDQVSCPTESTTVTEADTGAAYLEEAFGSYLNDVNVDDPFSADQYYNPTDPFTWNYSQSTVSTLPASGSPLAIPEENRSGGWWKDLYNKLYGTPYPHLEPWKLQGYAEKPDWWDAEYLNNDPATYGNRRWKYIHRCNGSPCTAPATGSPLPAGGPGNNSGMWENIRLGRVPAGYELPDGTVSTGISGEALRWGVGWNYFSVNVDDVEIDGYQPDDLFPPFWDFSANGGSNFNRSVFSSFVTEILLPGADYTYETGAPEWFEWTQSAQRLYDDLTVGYRLQPVRFVHNTFGVEFIEVGGKQINRDTCKVYSHRDVQFHGDIINTNEVLKVQGINQWYVNFNRFSGFDTTASDFRPLWQTWEPKLAYQFGSIIDTQTFNISNDNFDVSERDYEIVLKRSPGIEDYFFDAFKVKIIEAPNQLASKTTENLWRFQLSTYFPDVREINYYEVHDYPVNVSVINNTFTVYQYNIVDVDQSNGTFTVAGNQTDAFTTSADFTISQSTGNDGSYTATSIVYDQGSNTTIVSVGSVLPDNTVDGVLTAEYRTHPWETGDIIEIQSTQVIPSPFRSNTSYYVIKIDDYTFQLAATRNDAITATPIVISSAGSGFIRAGQVFNTFKALGGATTDIDWKHYVIDKRFVRSFVPPTRIQGMQNLINIIDGYAVIKNEEGWDVNFELLEEDPQTERPVSWQVEIERFIDQAFKVPRKRSSRPESYGVTVDPLTDVFTFGSLTPDWTTGTRVQFRQVDNPLPTPLLPNTNYYIIRDTATEFKVAATQTDALLGNEINIIGGINNQFSVLQPVDTFNRAPEIEINPCRNNVWFKTPRGVIADIVTGGASQDIRNLQLVVDQNGNELDREDISVFRWDRISRIYVPQPIDNPTVPQSQQNQYNTLHISALHLLIDGYESAILFNDRSVDNVLIYDPFVGLNTARFNMQYFRQNEFTQRPVVGGYFLTPDSQILRNIEASVKDLENIYDTFRVLETTPLTRESRKSLGYNGPGSLDYLENIGLNPKSQFLFWRGFIQNKGSVNAINAFTNSRLFEDAEVDEYWAYKVAEFGSSYDQEYPALQLFVEDSQRNEKRFEFIQPGEQAQQTFEGILLSNEERWREQPNVLQVLEDNGSAFYFDAKVSSVIEFTKSTLPSVGVVGSPNNLVYVESEVPFDDVVVVRLTTNNIPGATEFTDFTIKNANLVEFDLTSVPQIPAPIGSPEDVYRLYTINVAENKQNPAKIRDYKDGIVISEIILWDPARGNHYPLANNVVTFESDNNPAVYTNSLDLSKTGSNFWGSNQVGEVWWDTSQRDYVSYYDDKIFSLNDKIQNWGNLADWADVRLYQWTESDVPPQDWNALAEVEELDATIDPKVRKTGRVKTEVFQRERTPVSIVRRNGSSQDIFPSTAAGGSPLVDGVPNTITVSDPDDTLAVGDRVVLTTTDELPLPLQEQTFYYIIDIVNIPGSPEQKQIKVSLEEDGNEVEITPGPLLVTLDAGSPTLTNPANPTDPTGLVNDFDTSGFQDVLFDTVVTGNTLTGLQPGTSGFQQFSLSQPFGLSSQTGLQSNTSGSQAVILTNLGSPQTVVGNCSDKTQLGPFNYSFTIVVDGVTYDFIYPGPNSSEDQRFNDLAVELNDLLDGIATVSCERFGGSPGDDIQLVFRSLTTGPSSSVQIVPPPGSPVSEPLDLFIGFSNSIDGGVANSLSNGYSVTFGSPQSGTFAEFYTLNFTVDATTTQSVSISGNNAQTYQELIDLLNSSIVGATANFVIIGSPQGSAIRITSNTTGISSSIDITSGSLLTALSATLEPQVNGTSQTYQTAISVNGGGQQTITITGDDAQTYQDLINVLNSNYGGADATLIQNPGSPQTSSIRITSTATGSNSSIDIIDPVPTSTFDGVFESLNSVSGSPLQVPVDGVNATSYSVELDFGTGPVLVDVIGNQVQTWSDLLEEINNQLPVGVVTAEPSDVSSVYDLRIDAGNSTVDVFNDGLFTRLGETLAGSPIFDNYLPQNTGEGTHTIVPPFRDQDWVQIEQVRKELFVARDAVGPNQFDLSVPGSPPNNIQEGDVVNVYKNGITLQENVTVGASGVTTIPGTTTADRLTIIKPRYQPTEEDIQFNPDVSDDGTRLIQYTEDFNFTEKSTIDERGNVSPRYYFWVENKTVRDGDNPSLRQAAIDLETIPTPFMIVDNLLEPVTGGSPLPRRYNQAIIRGLAGIVNDNDRYELRFTRDFTLRDQLVRRNYTTDIPAVFSRDRVNQDPLDLKTLHTEWTLIREKQPFNIARELWDNITEAMIGRKLNDPSVRVPSLERELYDLTFQTDTQYGLRDGQAFVRGDLALATILNDLQDPNNNFAPVDINSFFANNTFETEQGIIDAMDVIYNTFPFEDVNRIFFKVLYDAFTTKQMYPDIFKTSWVSLTGTQLLQTEDIFNG